MKYRITVFLIWTLAFGAAPAVDPLFFDKNNSETLVEALVQHGFENIHVTSRDDSALMIFYENRVYRNELYASGVVTALVQKSLKAAPLLVLVPCRRALPLCELEVDLLSYRALVTNSGAVAGLNSFIRVKNVSQSTPLWPTSLHRPAIGKIDLTLYPTFSVHLGNYDDRFKLFFALMPVLSTTLWQGAALYAEASIPLYNDVNYHYMRFRDYPQLSKAGFSQIVRLPFDVVAGVTAGAFNPNRWGVGGDINKLFLNRHLAIGYSIEYTGFLLYYDALWNYSPLNLKTDKIYAWYYADFMNSQIGLSYNSYVMKDSGVLFEFSRNFRDTTIGFFFGETEIDKFGGIMIRFPFSPPKQPAPGRVRLSLPRYYEYSYRATNYVYTQHAPIQTGISVYTGTKLAYLYQNLTPNYVRHNTDLYKMAFDYITTISERSGEDETLFHYLKRK